LRRESAVEGIVDIHTHILPGMDDGAQSLEDALAMARVAQESGTSLLVATPHMDFASANTGGASEVVRSRARALTAALESSGIPVRVLPGMETAMDLHLPRLLACGEVLTIGDSGRYVLVELPFQQIPEYAEKVVFELASAGYTPVIAHPERCADVLKDPNRMYRLVRAGAIGQVNAGSLTGAFGRSIGKVAKILLGHGLAHVVASDGHSPTGARPCRLDQAFAVVSRLLGREGATRAAKDVPQAMVLGESVRLETPERYSARRWFVFGVVRG
jgi:protein-tyrosine phosphatase